MTALSVLAARSSWARRPLQQVRLPQLKRVASTEADNDQDRLHFPSIDQKWRHKWQRMGEEQGPVAAQKKYILSMFPYPSGALHMGHVRVYTISDVLARFWRLRGYHAIHPMGWDAFGLPAENAAIERGIDPAEWTVSNIEKMKGQLQAMNGHWDWDRELMTCDPSYYKHTQRLFLYLHSRGLAYQEEAQVNWDPVDGTVLANEQVDSNGCSWRSGAKVERRLMKQWFLRITAFKEALLEDIDSVLAKDGRWPERVLTMQKNWLGRSTGQRLQFQMQTIDGEHLPPAEIFTTRIDTLFGVQYVALSLEHPIVKEMAQGFPELQKFIDDAPYYPPDSKAGFLLPGVHAINPASSLDNPSQHVQKPLPVFVAPYVLSGYGSGAVMGVPGHDARDFAFWKENQGNTPILKVVENENAKPVKAMARDMKPAEKGDKPFYLKGRLSGACGPVSGLKSDEAISELVKLLRASGQEVEIKENWRLRDWLISRQRYWGAPIPIVHCDSCGPVPVKESDLPVQLPKLVGSQLGKGGNPLADEKMSDWVNTECPKCSKPAKRETDTMDTFIDSSWYFLRFADPHNDKELVGRKEADDFLPIDVYIGGVEHAILHLLYARFISKFLASTEKWGGGGSEFRGEPFKKLITQGMVHGITYKDPDSGRFLKPDELFEKSDAVHIKETGKLAAVSYEKMSKSKYNGVDPVDCISKWGADTTRAHILFQAPVTEVLKWDEKKIVGIQRWFRRVWKLTRAASDLPLYLQSNSKPPRFLEETQPRPPQGKPELGKSKAADEVLLDTQKTIRKVTNSLESTISLNTVISDLTKLTNALLESIPADGEVSINTSGNPVLRGKDGKNLLESEFPQRFFQAVQSLLIMLAPIAPAFAEECYELLVKSPAYRVFTKAGREQAIQDLPPPQSIFTESFPSYSDELIDALSSQDIPVAIKVDGQIRLQTLVPAPDMALMAVKTKEQKETLKQYLIEQVTKTTHGKRLFGPGKLYDLTNKAIVPNVTLVEGAGLKGQVLSIKRWKNRKEQAEWFHGVHVQEPQKEEKKWKK
ncbi:leucyl-tRNA synthetase [Phyllosticta capitalensis]